MGFIIVIQVLVAHLGLLWSLALIRAFGDVLIRPHHLLFWLNASVSDCNCLILHEGCRCTTSIIWWVSDLLVVFKKTLEVIWVEMLPLWHLTAILRPGTAIHMPSQFLLWPILRRRRLTLILDVSHYISEIRTSLAIRRILPLPRQQLILTLLILCWTTMCLWFNLRRCFVRLELIRILGGCGSSTGPPLLTRHPLRHLFLFTISLII